MTLYDQVWIYFVHTYRNNISSNVNVPLRSLILYVEGVSWRLCVEGVSWRLSAGGCVEDVSWRLCVEDVS